MMPRPRPHELCQGRPSAHSRPGITMLGSLSRGRLLASGEKKGQEPNTVPASRFGGKLRIPLPVYSAVNLGGTQPAPGLYTRAMPLGNSPAQSAQLETVENFGRRSRIRTCDPPGVIGKLYRLSYPPTEDPSKSFSRPRETRRAFSQKERRSLRRMCPKWRTLGACKGRGRWRSESPACSH